MADNKKSLSGGVSGKLLLKVLIILIGIIALVLSYFLGYSAFAEQTASVQSEISTLQSEVAVLNAMNEKQDDYVKEMDDMNAQIAFVERKFPSMIKAEDVIIYADALEKSNEMQIAGIEIGEAELAYSTADTGEEVYVEEPVEGEVVEEGGEAAEPTEEENLQAEYAKYGVVEDYYYDLYSVPITYNFNVDYFNFKTAIQYIRDAADTQSLRNVVLTYNPETGDLNGNLIVSDYVLSGSGNSYTAPSLPEIPVGTLNPFTGLGNDPISKALAEAEAENAENTAE